MKVSLVFSYSHTTHFDGREYDPCYRLKASFGPWTTYRIGLSISSFSVVNMKLFVERCVS